MLRGQSVLSPTCDGKNAQTRCRKAAALCEARPQDRAEAQNSTPPCAIRWRGSAQQKNLFHFDLKQRRMIFFRGNASYSDASPTWLPVSTEANNIIPLKTINIEQPFHTTDRLRVAILPGHSWVNTDVSYDVPFGSKRVQILLLCLLAQWEGFATLNGTWLSLTLIHFTQAVSQYSTHGQDS